MRVAVHPGLYDPAATEPVLAGSRCNSCGRVAFPALAIGCDACGSSELELVELEAAGSLFTFAEVHVYRGADIEAPFTIGEVELDSGPLIRVTMGPDQPDLAVGDRVRGVWRVATIDEQGDEVVEPAFIGLDR